MRSLRTILPALLLVLGVGGVASAQPAVPELIYAAQEGASTPLWVSAEAGLADGEPRPELFSPLALTELDNLIASAQAARLRQGEAIAAPDAAGCSIVTVAAHGQEARSLADSARDFPFVVTGTVQASADGFLHGTPRSLYAIEVDRVLKAPAGVEVPPELLATFPTARIELAVEVLCERGSRYPLRPVVGSRVAVFGTRVEADSFLLLVDGPGWLFEDAAGRVFLPGQDVERTLDPVGWEWVESRLGDLFPAQGGER